MKTRKSSIRTLIFIGFAASKKRGAALLSMCRVIGLLFAGGAVLPQSSGTTLYVSVNSADPAIPYSNWSTAAKTIQEAVDIASAGDEILVTNGVYDTGGRSLLWMSNRVAVTKPVTVRSVNGPAATLIVGSGPHGPQAVRCAYLAGGASLLGFALTNGATRTDGDWQTNQSGGGVWCEDTTAVVSNCVIVGNSANDSGGGAFKGTLNNCLILSNSAVFQGGGVFASALRNCQVTGNRILGPGVGGGAFGGLLINSVIVGNHSLSIAGGVYGSTLRNCIVYYNSNPDYYASDFSYCCATPQPAGSYNFTNAPLFVDTNNWKDLHLRLNSPCINAGYTDPNDKSFSGTADLDSNPRVSGGAVDLGPYEIQQPASSISYEWLDRFQLPTDGSSDHRDEDNDGMNNWQEWAAGTVPTNHSSALRIVSLSNTIGGISATWESVDNRTYSLERATNLAFPPVFICIASNIAGVNGLTTITDTNLGVDRAKFYRVGVTH